MSQSSWYAAEPPSAPRAHGRALTRTHLGPIRAPDLHRGNALAGRGSRTLEPIRLVNLGLHDFDELRARWMPEGDVRECHIGRAARRLHSCVAMMSTPCLELKPGIMIGSYRIDGELGRGGMGTVFSAQHVVLRRRAAIKVMHHELCRHPGMASRLVQEAAILDDIRHPGLVRVFECNVLPDHRPYIVMELVEGEPLTMPLARHRRLPWHEVTTLLGDVAGVLAAVHAYGIVHRDLKPDNLLLTPNDPDYPLRVIDWGVARLGPVGRLTLEGVTAGTPIYMSPEQACGQQIAPPCDVYSLGVIAYEALCGHPPFDGCTLAEVVCRRLTTAPLPLARRCDVPDALAALVHRMLDTHPGQRPTAVEVGECTRALPLDDDLVVEPIVDLDLDDDLVAETAVVDPVELEFGTTEILPTLPRPRWTPQLETLPSRPRARPSAAGGMRDQVSGEIVARRR
jgi:serine/threonine protein kinase